MLIQTEQLMEVKSSNKYSGKAFSPIWPKMWNLLPTGTVQDVADTKKFK